jgi:hypothetical protein
MTADLGHALPGLRASEFPTYLGPQRVRRGFPSLSSLSLSAECDGPTADLYRWPTVCLDDRPAPEPMRGVILSDDDSPLAFPCPRLPSFSLNRGHVLFHAAIGARKLEVKVGIAVAR